jgi:hypothetical protein
MGQHMGQAGCESTADFVQKRVEMFHVKRTRLELHVARMRRDEKSVSRETLFWEWLCSEVIIILLPL